MNNYHIYEEIGRGSGSIIYKGREKRAIQYVAIKAVDKALKERVLHEVSILYKLQHGNIRHFLTWYETSRHLWLILEYCTGGTLLAMLKQDGKFPESAIRVFAYDLVQGLLKVHQSGFVYGDLKPSNILIDEFGVLKLAGFALSREIPNKQQDYSTTSPAGAGKRGSPFYMSPELFYAECCHSFASDLYALGCCLFELSAGRPPFNAPTLDGLVNAILNEEPDYITECSEEFNDLVRRCLEKNPCDRISWPAFVSHPFWKEFPHPLTVPELPAEPLFEQLYNRQPIDEEAQESIPEDSFDYSSHSLRGSSTFRRSDLLRISINAKRNLIRQKSMRKIDGEAENENEQEESDKGGNDLALKDCDAEIDFGEPEESQFPVVPSTPSEGSVLGQESQRDAHSDPPSSASVRQEEFDDEEVPEEIEGEEEETFEHRRQTEPAVIDEDDESSYHEEQLAMEREMQAKPEEAVFHLLASQQDLATQRNTRAEELAEQEAELAELQSALSARPSGRPEPLEPKRQLSKDRPISGSSKLPKSSASTKSSLPATEKIRRPSKSSASAPPSKPRPPSSKERHERKASRDFEPPAPSYTPASSDFSSPESSTGSSVSPPSLSFLLIHPIDTSIKPLAGNSKIEKLVIPKLKVDASGSVKGLSFPHLSAEAILQLGHAELETFLTAVYRDIGSGGAAAPLQQRVNGLVFLQGITIDQDQIANLLVNSTLVALFVKMLKVFKQPALQFHLLALLALLVRYATYIGPAMAESGILSVLSDLMRDSNVATRRRAICALGELLFFISSELHLNPESQSLWRVPQSAIKLLIRSLRPSEDEIVRHYATKSVENILAQSGATVEWLADSEVALALFGVYNTSKAGPLRISAISALSLLLFREPSLCAKLYEKLGPAVIFQGLDDENPRILLAFLNLLNLLLANAVPRLQAALWKEKKFGAILVKILAAGEAPSENAGGAQVLRCAVKAKALLTICLVMQGNSGEVGNSSASEGNNTATPSLPALKWFCSLFFSAAPVANNAAAVPALSSPSPPPATSLLSAFDRLDRDRSLSSYLSQSLDRFFLHFSLCFHQYFSSDHVSLLQKSVPRKNLHQDSLKALIDSVSLYQLLLLFLSSNVFRVRVFHRNFLDLLLNHLALLDGFNTTQASLGGIVQPPWTPSSAASATSGGFWLESSGSGAPVALSPSVNALLSVRTCLIALLDGLIQCSEILAILSDFETTKFSALVTSLLANVFLFCGDIRFLALKAVTDLLLFYFNHHADSPAAAQQNSPFHHYRNIWVAIFSSHLLPRFSLFFLEKHPIPQYSLKLLASVIGNFPEILPALFVEGNSGGNVGIQQIPAPSVAVGDSSLSMNSPLAAHLLTFFDSNHPNNSIHTLRLVALLARDENSSFQALLHQHAILPRAAQMLEFTVSTRIDYYYLLLLDIFQSVLSSSYVGGGKFRPSTGGFSLTDWESLLFSILSPLMDLLGEFRVPYYEENMEISMAREQEILGNHENEMEILTKTMGVLSLLGVFTGNAGPLAEKIIKNNQWMGNLECLARFSMAEMTNENSEETTEFEASTILMDNFKESLIILLHILGRANSDFLTAIVNQWPELSESIFAMAPPANGQDGEDSYGQLIEPLQRVLFRHAALPSAHPLRSKDSEQLLEDLREWLRNAAE